MPCEPKSYDIEISQGVLFELPLRLLQPNGTPVDLRGFSAQSQICLMGKAPKVLAEFHARIIPDEGRIVLALSPELTAALPVKGPYGQTIAYDVLLIDADGVPVRKLLRGAVTIIPAVTRV